MKQKLTSGAEVANVAQQTTAQPSVKSGVKSSVNLCVNPDERESMESTVPIEDEILTHAFLTIEEVAQLLRVSKRTVYNLIYRYATRDKGFLSRFNHPQV